MLKIQYKLRSNLQILCVNNRESAVVCPTCRPGVLMTSRLRDDDVTVTTITDHDVTFYRPTTLSGHTGTSHTGKCTCSVTHGERDASRTRSYGFPAPHFK